jgi:ADP-ribose diphosphatase
MKVISSRELLKNKLFSVVEEVATDPGGFEIKRSIIRHPGSAVMMAVDDHDRVLLVKQFRLPAQRELWELPAGRLDPGESPLQAAKRELREETGYAAKEWTKIATFWASPGYVDEKMHLFLAHELTQGEQEPMEDERIEIHWFAAKELQELVRDGKILDAKTLIGYYSWLDHKKTHRSSKKATRSSKAAPSTR